MAEPAVHQERPHVAERDLTIDQILDVHAAVAQRTAVLIRLGDLGGEGHHAGKTLDEILMHRSHRPILAPYGVTGVALSRWLQRANTWPKCGWSTDR